MLFCSKVTAGEVNDVPLQVNVHTLDYRNIILGGGYRLPVRTAGGYGLPAQTADAGNIRLGGGYRLPVGAG